MRNIIAVVLIALLTLAGAAGAVTFDKPHVQKNLTMPILNGPGVANAATGDIETVYLPEHQLVIGIDATKYFGGIVEASANQQGFVYMVHYNQNGFWEGLFPQTYYNGEIPHHLGFTSNIPATPQNWAPAFESWADNRELAAHGFHVINGHIYDANGREYVYKQGAPTEGQEIGENPVSNPGLPETGDQTISYTVGDLTDQ